VILFLAAGLLSIAPRARDGWELIASRLETGFSSHVVSSTGSSQSPPFLLQFVLVWVNSEATIWIARRKLSAEQTSY